ncbi:zinc-dependent alcohol dehydrogenase family protein [Streptomyces sp. NPDC007088]|uniref:zinc-dependent alcohol dehydrogenase family protein n=1 Tax=Streptomyces sp. NPDC007088 TaxID=3364773 RepID=UPI0036897264
MTTNGVAGLTTGGAKRGTDADAERNEPGKEAETVRGTAGQPGAVGRDVVTGTVVFDALGGPEVLSVRQLPLRTPAAGEVLVRVEALGVNRAEALFRSGGYYYLPTLPGSRLGYEAAGVVEAVGEEVTRFRAGDAVLTGPGIEMSAQGVYAERVVLPEDSVVRRPAGVDAVAGAASWLAYSTAYGGLLETGGLRPGDVVLITAASSGVGIAALQTAARIGAVPVAVTRTVRKREALFTAGAAHIVVTGEEDTVASVKALTGGLGADLLFDAVGGAGLAGLATALRVDGTVVVYGWLDGTSSVMPMNWPLTVRGYANQALSGSAPGRRRIDAWLASGLRDGTLRPVIAEEFEGLASMPDAHRRLEENRHTGKLVVRLS